MTKLKSTKLKLYGVIALALALGVVGAWKGVSAYQSSNPPKVVAEAGSVVNLYEAEAPEALPEEPSFGAVSGPFLPNPHCEADECTYVASGDFQDATTTFVSVPSYWTKVTSTGAGSEVILRYEGGVGITAVTSTVDQARIYINGAATTSIGVSCGASATAVRTAVVALRELVTTTAYSVVTSSANQVIENNVTAAQGASLNGGTVNKIMIGSDAPYFICVAKATDDAGLTNADNTFTGKYVVRFKWRRQ